MQTCITRNISLFSANDDQVFGISSEQAVFDKYEVKKDAAIVLVKKFDEGRNDYEGEMKAEVFRMIFQIRAHISL